MAISIDKLTKVISVPQSDLTFVSGTLYEMDLDWFRLELKDWEDSPEGIVCDVPVSCTTRARSPGGSLTAAQVYVVPRSTPTAKRGPAGMAPIMADGVRPGFNHRPTRLPPGHRKSSRRSSGCVDREDSRCRLPRGSG